MRSRLLFLAIGLVVGVALTSGAVWAYGYRTHVSADGSSYAGVVSDASPSATYTFAAARVCKEGPADVKITRVRIAESFNGIKLVDFAVAPSSAYSNRVKGDLQTYLDEVGKNTMTAPPTKKLATRCSPEHNDLRDIIVEMRLPAEADLPAAAIRFVIDYTVMGRTKSLTTDTGITFCRGGEADKQIDELIAERDDTDAIGSCDFE